jgi:hypothetical protein
LKILLYMEKKEWILYFIFFVFSLTFIALVIIALQRHSYSLFLWVCYIVIGIILIGIYKRNPKIILSQIIILAIPDLFWLFDLIYLVFVGHPFFGLIYFNSDQSLLEKILEFQHLYVIPLAIISLLVLKVKRDWKILLISFGEAILIFFLTLLFVPSTLPINCVHITCINFPITFLPYPLIWFLFEFSFIIISYFVLVLLFAKKKPN